MEFNAEHLLYEEDSFGIFILVSVVMGGGAAWLAGRAIALTWRPWWHVAYYMLILGVAVRFFHFALFEGTFLSLHYYVVDSIVCIALGFLSFRITRVGQMVSQYRWAYRKSGLFQWVRRPVDSRESG